MPKERLVVRVVAVLGWRGTAEGFSELGDWGGE